MTTNTKVINRPADEQSYGQRIEPGAVRFERLLPGPIERVWSYLVDSDKRVLWLASGAMPGSAGADFDFRFDHKNLSPGNRPTPERFKGYDGGATTHHKVLRFEPPHVLAITWGGRVESPSEVTFELFAVGDKVRLVLTHRRLSDGYQTVDVSGGWHTHLQFLEAHLSGQALPSFWDVFADKEQEYGKRYGVPIGVPSRSE